MAGGGGEITGSTIRHRFTVCQRLWWSDVTSGGFDNENNFTKRNLTLLNNELWWAFLSSVGRAFPSTIASCSKIWILKKFDRKGVDSHKAFRIFLDFWKLRRHQGSTIVSFLMRLDWKTLQTSPPVRGCVLAQEIYCCAGKFMPSTAHCRII